MCKIIGYEKISFSDKQTNELIPMYMIYTAEPFPKQSDGVGHKSNSLACSPEKFVELNIKQIYDEEKAVEFYFRKGGNSIVFLTVY